MGLITTWNTGQGNAIEEILEWAKNPWGGRSFALGGLAGTGKTYLTGYIATELIREGLRVQLCAPTGRAASVLADKAKRDHGMEIPARTVHSVLRYGPASDSHEEDCSRGSDCVCIASQSFVKAAETDFTQSAQTVVIVDEASMVTAWMYSELMDLGAKILFVGDYGQLPPVGESNFSAVAEAGLDAKLTEIVRQESGNPIIELAWDVRAGADWSTWTTASDAVKIVNTPIDQAKIGWNDGKMVLCYTNKQRVRRNRELRKRRWGTDFKDAPLQGDVVICLRNDPSRQVFNGQRGIVEGVSAFGDDPHLGLLRATMEGDIPYVGPVVRAQFGNERPLANEHGGLFDFGYALTVHKAQGSEANDVIVLGERLFKMTDDDQRKWRYTAVTRAKKRLTVVTGKS